MVQGIWADTAIDPTIWSETRGFTRSLQTSALAQLVDVGVPLADAGQELTVRRVVWLRWSDQRSQGRGVQRLLALVGLAGRGLISQADAVLVGGAFDGAGERVQQVPPVCHLDRYGGAGGCRLKVLHRSRQITLLSG
ncbi:hypothetical protein ACFQ7O_30415 [Streptomyces sp. NPDC056485]|uniref:hypothetical protein n=1 Tax=Streptomyces sp. NPDC056485 TaxID=3345834 RepID=UPI0036C0E416